MCEKRGVLAFPSHMRASDKIDIRRRGLPWTVVAYALAD